IDSDYEVDGICYLLTENGELAVTNKTTVSVDTLYIDSLEDPYMEVVANREEGRSYEGSVVVPAEVYVEELGKTLPVVKVMTGAFMDSPELVSVTLPESVTDMENYVFANCQNLKSTDLMCRIPRIGIRTFYNCPALKTFEIPASVSSVDEFAFDHCSVNSLTFTSALSWLCPYSFSGALSLKSITIPVASPEDIYSEYEAAYLDNPKVIEVTKGCVLYVPQEGVEAYKASEVWSAFANIHAIGSAAISEVEAATTVGDGPAYNLLGQPVANPRHGDIIIRHGKKSIAE
ncbi:MAG: leucine-rich repeat domain-containing protein, partial [Muribaculaceae bacterium]|nr:leucine-rich repeat domain-containing protein [Muribaculaceae bacterium]